MFNDKLELNNNFLYTLNGLNPLDKNFFRVKKKQMTAKQMTSFYLKCNTGLKWVKYNKSGKSETLNILSA